MQKLAIFGFLTLALFGCSGVEFVAPPCPGTRHYDVQLCRGEKPVYLPNPPYAALQRKAKCDACIDIENNCYHGIPPQCRPKPWR